ncbi:hypothetical protein NUACC21_75030 [Scytonema sp. NUACC21]
MIAHTSIDISPIYSVVMTACINPGGENVYRSKPEVRLKDYENSLRFWLELKESRIKNIIFIENSGYPLEKLIEISQSYNPWNRECEFISLNCNEIPSGLHYGYAEFKLLDVGLLESKIFVKSDYLIKATGRYKFPAISRLLNCLPKEYKLAADTRNVSRFVPYPRQNVTVALILFSRDFYHNHLREIYKEMQLLPRKSFIEDILYDKLMPIYEEPGIILRWPCNCEPQGIGGNGQSYTSLKKRSIAVCRAVGRIMLPNWWF